MLALAEAWILAVWIGALVGFAFIFAPIAFRTIPDIDLFTKVTTRVLGALATLGYVCGSLAVMVTVWRAIRSSAPRLDLIRTCFVVLMLALVAYQARTIVPEMETTSASFHVPITSITKSDPRRVRYDALHHRSSVVYGAVLLLGFATIAIATLRKSSSA